ncbi:MAG TPA: hypothetical protein VGD77_08795, partial [Gemmatimonadaceae bacterium]
MVVHIVDRFLPDFAVVMRLALACAACLVLGCGNDAPRAASPSADSAAPRPGDLLAGAARPAAPPALADTTLRLADSGDRATRRGGAPWRAESGGDVAPIAAAPGSVTTAPGSTPTPGAP